MGQKYLDRYNSFKSDSNYKPLPGINLPEKDSDKIITYKLGSTRFDRLSDKYYDTPYYGWLIMLANPQYGGLEFEIPDNSLIRIPFPFKASVNDYLKEIDTYKRLYD
jgi:hypothetical protein